MLPKNKEIKNLKRTKELLDIIGHIINDEHFKELRKMRHHLFFSRYEHLINASVIAYRLAKFFKADIKTCVTAAVLHDFTFYRGITHGSVASKNAEKFDVTKEMKQIIDSHMYPLLSRKIKRPKGKNFWVVTMADKFAATYEYFFALSHLNFNYRKIKIKRNRVMLKNLEELFPVLKYIEEKFQTAKK